MKGPPSIATIAIGAFLLLQIGLPLSYYLGDNEYDERFAWRMFSPVRMARCSFQLSTYENGTFQPLPLSKEYHVVWINLAKRARVGVIDAMVERSCRSHTDVRVDLRCATPKAPAIGLCRNAMDADGDGTPDGYNSLVGCAESTPEACFQADCPSGELAGCKARLCSRQLSSPDQNRCSEYRDQ